MPEMTPGGTPLNIDDEIQHDEVLRESLHERLERLRELAPSRERALAITKLQEAIMWLGQDLNRLGRPGRHAVG